MANRISKLVRYAKLEAADSDNNPVTIAMLVKNPPQILAAGMSPVRHQLM